MESPSVISNIKRNHPRARVAQHKIAITAVMHATGLAYVSNTSNTMTAYEGDKSVRLSDCAVAMSNSDATKSVAKIPPAVR